MKAYRSTVALSFALSLLGLLTVSAIVPCDTASADERIASRKQLLDEGYLPVQTHAAALRLPPAPVAIPAHSLPWPIKFQDSQHTLGNVMAQYQPFGDPYFHGGIDIRTVGGWPVHTPVAGRLEAGHYGYATNPDGSMTKMWKPWPSDGDATYFEVGIVMKDGTRFEFHHMNHDTLPKEIVAALNKGNVTVPAGTLLGSPISWIGEDYDHIHYNIITPEGIRINPEYASTLIKDTLAPEVSAKLAVMSDGLTVRDFGDGVFTESPKEFVFEVVDHQDGNIYDHPPALSKLRFDSGQETVWDFRSSLTGADGKFPNLFQFVLESIAGPGGQLQTTGGYGTGKSLVRLKVPTGAKGKFSITFADQAGNTGVSNGEIR